MNKTLEVETRAVYGVTKIYPVNDAAKALAYIARTTTLREDDLYVARERLGLTIVDVTPSKLKGF